jgi:hypothetical protein
MVVFLSSCVNLSRRFKSHQNYWVNNDDVKKYVNVSAETYNISEITKSPTATKDLFTLTPEGQAELIKALAAKTNNVDDLITGLTKKLSSDATSTVRVKVFPITINKSIVFSVDRRWVSEGYIPDGRIFNRIADRLLNLEMSVNLPSSSLLKFNSWDKFVTDWVTVDLGKVTSSQQWSATANVNASLTEKITNTNKLNTEQSLGTKSGKADISQTETTGSEKKTNDGTEVNETSSTLGPSANLNITDKYETSLNLLLSRMKLSGTLSKEKMTLRQEGAFGVDLSGNTSISVEYIYNGEYATPISVFKIPNYYTTGTAIPAATITKNKIMWIFPNISSTVTGTIQYKYLYRYVRKWSKKHIPEARQRVYNYYGEVGYGDSKDDGYIPPISFDLIKAEDLKPVTYRVGTGSGLAFQYLNWDNEIINFETAIEAANFMEYIINLSKTTKAYGAITNTPTSHDFSSYRIIKYQN